MIQRHSRRTVDSLGIHPQPPGVCPTYSPGSRWHGYDLSNSTHYPPNGPDCLSGCGYTGLPCYVCSCRKLMTGSYKSSVFSRDGRLNNLVGDWNRIRLYNRVFPTPIHLSSNRGAHARYSGSPPTYRSLFPSNFCNRIENAIHKRFGCNETRLSVFCIFFILYVLVVMHVVISGIKNAKSRSD